MIRTKDFVLVAPAYLFPPEYLKTDIDIAE